MSKTSRVENWRGALLVLACRQVLSGRQWVLPENFIRVSFFGLNIGLALMLAGSLFPGGVLRLKEVLTNGYWHARGLQYTTRGLIRLIEWCRLPGDMVFILVGVIPPAIAICMTYLRMQKDASPPTAPIPESA